jgi:homogentisate 1,2-dioxygenase
MEREQIAPDTFNAVYFHRKCVEEAKVYEHGDNIAKKVM